MEDTTGVVVDNYSLRGNSGLILEQMDPSRCEALNVIRKYDLIVLQYGLNVVSDEVASIRLVQPTNGSCPGTCTANVSPMQIFYYLGSPTGADRKRELSKLCQLFWHFCMRNVRLLNRQEFVSGMCSVRWVAKTVW
jgi:hypothetical protein